MTSAWVSTQTDVTATRALLIWKGLAIRLLTMIVIKYYDDSLKLHKKTRRVKNTSTLEIQLLVVENDANVKEWS